MEPKRNSNGEIVCPQCEGEGRVRLEEDGRQVEDACYKCATTGVISEEQWEGVVISDIAGRMAELVDAEYRRSRRHDEDGDDESLCAAECGMSTYDYQRDRVFCLAHNIGEDLSKLDRGTIGALTTLVNALESAWEAARNPRPATCARCHNPKDATGQCDCDHIREEAAATECADSHDAADRDNDIPF